MAVLARPRRWEPLRSLAAIENAAHVHVAHHIDGGPATVKKPIHRKQQRDVTRREMDSGENHGHRDESGFRISLPTQSGRVYRLEHKESITDAAWTALPLVAGNGGALTLRDATATARQRFYRVRRW